MTIRSTGTADVEKADADWASPSHVHIAFLMLSLFFTAYLCYLIALPFLPSLSWAIGLSVLATPLQKRLETKLGHPGLCALACTSLLELIVVVPTTLLIQQLIFQASSGATLMEQKIEFGEWRS